MEGTQINHRLSSTGSDGGKPCKDGKRRYKYLPYEKPTQWTRCLSGCKKGWVRPTGYRMCEKKGKDTKGSKEVRHLNDGWLTASHIEFICEKWFKDRKFTSVYRATPYLEALAEKKGTRLNRTHSLSDQLAKKAKISSKVVFCIVNSGNSHWVVTAHTPTGHKFAWDSLKQQGKLRAGGGRVTYELKQCPHQKQFWECGYHALWNLKTLIDNVNAKKGERGLDTIDFYPSIHFMRNVQNAIYYDPKDGGDDGRLMTRDETGRMNNGRNRPEEAIDIDKTDNSL